MPALFFCFIITAVVALQLIKRQVVVTIQDLTIHSIFYRFDLLTSEVIESRFQKLKGAEHLKLDDRRTEDSKLKE
jgi:hypothetical protein